MSAQETNDNQQPAWMDKFDALVDKRLDEIFAHLHDRVTDFELSSESDIESLFARAIILDGLSPIRVSETEFAFDEKRAFWGMASKGAPFPSTSIEDLRKFDWAACPAVNVFQQVVVGQYRLDFLFGCKARWRVEDRETVLLLAVECDGHEFHEKTKEQAIRDKCRDRDLLCAGIPTMRFTGSEVWNHTMRCVEYVGRYFFDAAGSGTGVCLQPSAPGGREWPRPHEGKLISVYGETQ